MVSLLFAVALSSITPAPIKTNYEEAYQESLSQDKPLMVVVAAPWCPACNVLKQSTLEPMASTGELDDVSVAVLNRDLDPELADRLTKGERTLPQIILFSRGEDGRWKRRQLRGYQPKQPVRKLIRSALPLPRG